MEYMRIWNEVNIEEIKESLVVVDDILAHCPNCKKIGIELADLKKCPACGRIFKYMTSKETVSGKPEIVTRIRKKLPHLIFVDYGDYVRVTGKKGAESLFKI